jgi:hypothetical protein
MYEEIENRRKMLELVNQRIREHDEPGTIDIRYSTVRAFGDQLGISNREAERLFVRLLKGGYLHVVRANGGRDLYIDERQNQFDVAFISDLSDKGMLALGLLPPSDSVEGIREVLEALVSQIDESSSSEDEKERKKSAVRTFLDGLGIFVREMGTAVAIDAVKKGIGL